MRLLLSFVPMFRPGHVVWLFLRQPAQFHIKIHYTLELPFSSRSHPFIHSTLTPTSKLSPSHSPPRRQVLQHAGEGCWAVRPGISSLPHPPQLLLHLRHPPPHLRQLLPVHHTPLTHTTGLLRGDVHLGSIHTIWGVYWRRYGWGGR